MDLLFGRASFSVLQKERPERYQELLGLVPEEEFLRAQRQIELYALGQCWADHLLYVESLSDEIFLRGKVRGDPLMNYHKRLIEGFDLLQENVTQAVLSIFETAAVANGKIDLEQMGIKGPTSTRTYLVHDGTEGLDRFGAVGELAGAGLTAGLFFVSLLLEKIKMKRKNR